MMTAVAPLLRAGLWVAVGLALGWMHFRGLARTSRAYVDGGIRVKTVLVHAFRMLITGVMLYVIARRGAVPLLSAFVGLLAARAVVVRGVRKQKRGSGVVVREARKEPGERTEPGERAEPGEGAEPGERTEPGAREDAK